MTFLRFVVATDGDGDSVSLGSGTFLIQVQDDIPVQTSATVSGSVQEDALTDSNSNHQSFGNPEGVGQTTVATGLLTTLVSVGADEPGTFSLASNPSGLPVITSKGEAVHYSVTGDTLTGFVDTNSNGSVDAGERTVFTLKVTSAGAYTFTLLDQIDHPVDSPANDIQSVSLSFASAIQFTDADGDTITLSGNFTINVEDDIPVTTSNTLVTVDEDDLPAGNHDTTSPGDDNTSVSPVTGTLQFSVGADEPATVSFASLNATAVTDSLGNPVTAGGHALSYLWDAATHTLYATPDGTTGHAAFSVSVDPATGAYSFSLLGQVDHPGHDDPGVAGIQTAFEDNLVINLTYTVTDKDADAVTGTLSVNIDDDMPILAPSTANNLIVNGEASSMGAMTISATASFRSTIRFRVGAPPTFLRPAHMATFRSKSRSVLPVECLLRTETPLSNSIPIPPPGICPVAITSTIPVTPTQRSSRLSRARRPVRATS